MDVLKRWPISIGGGVANILADVGAAAGQVAYDCFESIYKAANDAVTCISPALSNLVK
jgi:hypothetical protein